MDTSNHHLMSTLFQQLGLPAEVEKIEAFVSTHKLQPHQRIENAPFWTASQAAFIIQCINDDSDWSTAVDHLDGMLRD